jgi:hypothetical protein
MVPQKAEYKYDVAFSFLAQDEAVATKLNGLLQNRMATFIYSKQQEQVAGTDGEKTFNAVFGGEARLVVVLYREGWGTTPKTRIEETAIRNRAVDSGYDFVKFIPLDTKATVPKWLRETQIWIGLDRWGLSGAASVIEARVQELGGQPHTETVEERAARLDRAVQFSDLRRQFLNSQTGVQAASEEFKKLIDAFTHSVASIKETAASLGSLGMKVENRGLSVIVWGAGPGMGIDWQNPSYSQNTHAAGAICSIQASSG